MVEEGEQMVAPEIILVAHTANHRSSEYIKGQKQVWYGGVARQPLHEQRSQWLPQDIRSDTHQISFASPRTAERFSSVARRQVPIH